MKKSNLLSPISWLYKSAASLRHTLYQRGFFKSADLGVKTISIGNITVGGTGKTPLTAYTASVLADFGEKVCILTRGYGRDNPKERVVVTDGEKIYADAREAGDEPFELAKKLSGKAVIIADANRIDAGRWAKNEYGITAFILDDGFQHLQLKRTLDIVLVDATNPFGNGKLLPAGILREPISGLRRADAIVITRTNLIENVAELRTEISQINPNCLIFISKNEFSKVLKLKNFPDQTSEVSKSKVQSLKSMAFCALGNPDNFFDQIRSEKFTLAATKAFPDHHIYTQSDIRHLEEIAIASGAEILLTTAKDAVKLGHLKFNLPCFVFENGLTFEDESAFIDLLKNH